MEKDIQADKQSQQQIKVDIDTHKNNQEEDLISDFSSMFKRKGNFVRQPTKPKQTETKSPNWLLEIPAKLGLTLSDLQMRRVMDNRKWMSIVKAGQQNSKIVAAVCSCWNYLQSEKGLGNMKFVSFKRCYEIIENKVDLKQIDEFKRINVIKQILATLNQTFHTNLSVSIIAKLAQPSIVNQSAQVQKDNLLQRIQENKSAYIYLAYQDVFCPIGFDKTFMKPIDAYAKLDDVAEQNQQLWIVNSTLGRNEPSFCIKRWSDIETDISTVLPEYLNIKQTKQGLQTRDISAENLVIGNPNCIIEIQ